jgi:hypothetical protein
MLVAKLSSCQVIYTDSADAQRWDTSVVNVDRMLFGIFRSSHRIDSVARMGIVRVAPGPDGQGYRFPYEVLFAVSSDGVLYRISDSSQLLGGSVRQMRTVRNAFHVRRVRNGKVDSVYTRPDGAAELHPICVRRNGRYKWGYADNDGLVRIAPQYRTAWEFRNGFAIVQKWSGWGCIDSSGRHLLRCLWRQMEYLDGNRVQCWLGRDGGWLSAYRVFEICSEEPCPVKAVRSSPEMLGECSHRDKGDRSGWADGVDLDVLLRRLEIRLQMKCSFGAAI